MFDNPVIWLSLVTLVIVLGIGFWQLSSVKQSKAKRGEADSYPVAPPSESVTSPTQAPVGPKPGTVPPRAQ